MTSHVTSEVHVLMIVATVTLAVLHPRSQASVVVDFAQVASTQAAVRQVRPANALVRKPERRAENLERESWGENQCEKQYS